MDSNNDSNLPSLSHSPTIDKIRRINLSNLPGGVIPYDIDIYGGSEDIMSESDVDEGRNVIRRDMESEEYDIITEEIGEYLQQQILNEEDHMDVEEVLHVKGYVTNFDDNFNVEATNYHAKRARKISHREASTSKFVFTYTVSESNGSHSSQEYVGGSTHESEPISPSILAEEEIAQKKLKCGALKAIEYSLDEPYLIHDSDEMELGPKIHP